MAIGNYRCVLCASRQSQDPKQRWYWPDESTSVNAPFYFGPFCCEEHALAWTGEVSEDALACIFDSLGRYQSMVEAIKAGYYVDEGPDGPGKFHLVWMDSGDPDAPYTLALATTVVAPCPHCGALNVFPSVSSLIECHACAETFAKPEDVVALEAL